MDTWDTFNLALGARLHADRVSRQNAVALQEQTREQAYHGYVAAYIAQGYTMEQAHTMVQDFFEEQNRRMAEIAEWQRAQARAKERRGNIFALRIILGCFAISALISGVCVLLYGWK